MKIIITLLSSIVLISILLTSCKVEPKEINYGNDHCKFCDMTVVDKTHAAQYVTDKGKAFMFDAIECMVRDINRNQDENKLSFILIADYGNPGELVDAKTAVYLISEAIKSPMGANLSGFGSKEKAQATLNENGGNLFNWSQLKEDFK